MNKVHQTFKRLRQKIDHAVGEIGVGASVLRTPHRGARTTYELHGVVTDLVNEENGPAMADPRSPHGAIEVSSRPPS